MNPRLRTLTLGAIPIVVLAVLASSDHVPGTDISLAVPYATEGPGPTYDTLSEIDGTPVVDIRGAETVSTTGELNMTTVLVRHNMSLAQALSRWLFTSDTIVPIESVFPQDKSEDEVREINKQAFIDSESAATLAAMKYLHRPTEVEVAHILDGSAAQDSVSVGERIIAVDGERVDQPAIVRDLVLQKKPGDTVRLQLVDAHGKQREVEIELGENPEDAGAPLLGVVMKAVPAGSLDVTFHLEDVGGPSAGLIFTLALIEKLTPEDINGSLDVAGTGTIAKDGTVGPIGGIQHKVTAAHREAKAQVFLAPAANCAEALKGDRGDMEIIKVTDVSGAVESLQAFRDGRDYPRCE